MLACFSEFSQQVHCISSHLTEQQQLQHHQNTISKRKPPQKAAIKLAGSNHKHLTYSTYRPFSQSWKPSRDGVLTALPVTFLKTHHLSISSRTTICFSRREPRGTRSGQVSTRCFQTGIAIHVPVSASGKPASFHLFKTVSVAFCFFQRQPRSCTATHTWPLPNLTDTGVRFPPRKCRYSKHLSGS